MKKQLLFILTTILSANCYAQIVFEKGYFITNDDVRTECLIENVDWRNNPTTFDYKLTENADIETATIKDVKDFGFGNALKFSRATVDIDRSSENLNLLSKEKEPVFSQETLFLKVLIQGKATLYQYVDAELVRYFYKVENSPIQQLIYKVYLVEKLNIAKNYKFRQQIWSAINCTTSSMNKVKNLEYSKADLISYFIEYNKCSKQDYINFSLKPKQDWFNLTLRPSFGSSSLSIEHGISDVRDADFGSKFNFRFGIETEFILPFNKNKWAIIIEPTYQFYKAEKMPKDIKVNVDYKSIEVPIGIRYYSFINADSKIFFNASYVLDYSFDSKMKFSLGRDLDVTSDSNFALGFGYNYINRYSVELRYNTARSILSKYGTWSSNYNNVSVILGYSIF